MNYKIIKVFIFFILFLSIFLIGIFVGYKQSFPFTYVKNVKIILEKKLPLIKIYDLYDELTRDNYHKKMIGCIEENNNIVNEIIKYRFFIAGHVYGKPDSNNNGLYPKFIDELKNDKDFSLGIFAGDIVSESNKLSWDTIDSQTSDFKYPLYFAPGNHDVGIGYNDKKRNLFISRYGNTYYSFNYKNDLFIILDPNLENWNIINEQLIFFKQTLSNIKPTTDNIFIISHQLIWIDKDEFNRASVNSLEGKQDYANYWLSIEPLLKKYNNNIFLIAGDTGAFDNGRELFCLKKNNITYIATGMGGGKRDNFLIFESTKNNLNIFVRKF